MSKDNGDTIVRQGDKWKRNGLMLNIKRVMDGAVFFYEVDPNNPSVMLISEFLVGAELMSSVDDKTVTCDFFSLSYDAPAQASIAIDSSMGTVNVAVCPSCSHEYPIKSDGSYEISKNGQCYRCQLGRSNAGKMKLNGVAETELLELQMAAVTATRDLGFKQGVDAERERLAGLIKAAKAVRNSLIEYDEDEYGSGEIFYCETMSESVDLLSEAVKEYETASKDDS